MARRAAVSVHSSTLLFALLSTIVAAMLCSELDKGIMTLKKRSVGPACCLLSRPSATHSWFSEWCRGHGFHPTVGVPLSEGRVCATGRKLRTDAFFTLHQHVHCTGPRRAYQSSRGWSCLWLWRGVHDAVGFCTRRTHQYVQGPDELTLWSRATLLLSCSARSRSLRLCQQSVGFEEAVCFRPSHVGSRRRGGALRRA